MFNPSSERKHCSSLLALLLVGLVSVGAALVSSESSTTSAPSSTISPSGAPPTEPNNTRSNPSSSQPSAAPTTTTTTASPSTSAATSPAPETTSRSIEEVKKIIHQHIDPTLSENRLAVNKPQTLPLVTMLDFAPDSIEARVSEATTRFGLNFINNLPDDIKDNVVLSPLSLQNLLNMVLLGADDNGASQRELNKVLGYEATNLANSSQERLKPHEAIRNVFQSILQATHLSFAPQPDPELLNTNSGSLQTPKEVAAHLQTSVKEGDIPLSGQVNFTLANLVLTDKSKVTLKQDYENELKTYYNVKVEHFSNSHNGPPPPSNQSDARERLPLHERVNNWVRNKTQNQIEKLASEEDLNGPDLAMVLLNAAHFKGRWLHTFNTRATHESTFFNGGSENGASKVKFMRQKAVFGYADFGTAALQNEMLGATDIKMRPSEDSETLLTEDDTGKAASSSSSSSSSASAGQQQSAAPVIELSKEEARRVELTSKLNCSALMLPFSLNDGQELSMVILLPARRDGLAELQAALSAQSLNEVYRSISEQQVQVELPKFSFEASHDAKATLLKMGLSSIFLDKPNLGRMFDQPAKVDKVIHKAKINVDESGAEAAAASMASIVLRNFIRPPTPVFVADHPFLFVIRHNRSNMPLFMGRVSNL